MKTLQSLVSSVALAALALTLVTGCQSSHPYTSNKIVTPGADMVVATDAEMSPDGKRQVGELKGTLSRDERSVLLEAAGSEATPKNTSPATRVVR